MGKNKVAKVEVPECRFGAACTRKGCVYRHPPKPARKEVTPGAEQSGQKKSERVCFAFVAGRCAFGRYCYDRHPDAPSCQTIRDKYAQIACQWGKGCRTEGCLYSHPSDEVVGPPMAKVCPRAQPAVVADGPLIAPRHAASQLHQGARPVTPATGPGPVWRAPEHGSAAEGHESSSTRGGNGASLLAPFLEAPPATSVDAGWPVAAPQVTAPPRRRQADEVVRRPEQHQREEQLQLEQEDEEEQHRAEALAAMLRCMGFDEEPTLTAAQRAGGNLNVAVEAALQGADSQAAHGVP